MAREELSLVQIKEDIEGLDIDKSFKELLLLTLGKLISESMDSNEIMDIFKGFLRDCEGIDIYSLAYHHNIIESATYVLVKEILRFEISRNLFFEEIYKVLQVTDNDEWLVALFEFFMCNTSTSELSELFGDKLGEFHDFFYHVVTADALKYYYDVDMWKTVGVAISGYVKNKIKEHVELEDVEIIYTIYSYYFFDCLNIEDSLYVFGYNHLNFIQFLLRLVDDTYEYENWWNRFDRRIIKEIEISKCISDAILNILKDYKVKRHDDPLFGFGFFDHLTNEDAYELIKLSKVNFFEVLMSYITNWEDYRNGEASLKEFIKERDIGLDVLILDILRYGDLEGYASIWKNWGWKFLKIGDIQGLFEEKALNFLENLLKMAFAVLQKEIEIKDAWNWDYLFPGYDLKSMKELLSDQIFEIVKRRDITLFVPIFSYRLLFFLTPNQIRMLLLDPDVNLFKLIFQTLNGYYNKIHYFLGDSLDDVIEKLFDSLNQINFSDFEIKELEFIERNIEENLSEFKDTYNRNKFNEFVIYIQRFIQEKEDYNFELDVQELINLVSQAAENKDHIVKGAVGFDGYGFVFRRLDYVSQWVSNVTSSKAISVDSDDYLRMNLEAIEFAGALKTLVPKLELGGDEILFDVWMFVKTPDNKMFPATFYYGVSGTSIGAYMPPLNKLENAKKTDFWPEDFASLVNYSPRLLSDKERKAFLKALREAMKKVPISYFDCIYEHDLGKLRMGYDETDHILEEIEDYTTNGRRAEKFKRIMKNEIEKGQLEVIEKIEHLIGTDFPNAGDIKFSTVEQRLWEERFSKIFDNEESLGLFPKIEGIVIKDGNVIGLGLSFIKERGLKELPKSIEKLKNLRFLDLKHCRLKELPVNIKNLKFLEFLNLEGNKLSPFPAVVTELSNLQRLNLSHSRVYHDIKNIPDSIKNLKLLKVLDLRNNKIEAIPESIGELRSLEWLNLNYNPLKLLPDSIGDLESLKYLSLIGTKFTYLPESFGNLSSLRELCLTNNKLEAFPESFGKLLSLEALFLERVNLVFLPNSFGNLKSLKFLYLKNNKLESLPDTIGNLDLLQIIDLEHNNLSDLPDSIGNLKSLKDLRLNNNKFKTLPETFSNLISIETLDMQRNNFTVLPDSIFYLKSLKKLYVGENEFTSLPETIDNLSALKTLILRNSKLKHLPESIGNLKNLKYLWVHYCELELIPNSIGCLQSLKKMILYNNKLTSLPDSIGDLKKLEFLDLGANNLSKLPESMWNLTSLKDLDLKENNLAFLSNSIENLINLEELDLAENNLKTIPQTLLTLPELKTIILTGNPLEMDSKTKSTISALRKKGIHVWT